MIFRIKHSFQLIFYFISSIPKRLWRIVYHPFEGISQIVGVNSIAFWWLEWLILFLDLFGIAELYSFVILWTRKNIRSLNEREQKLALSILKPNFINWQLVLINNSAFLGTKKHKIAYVSFNIINYWDHVRYATFIHELIHIWQYQRLGSVYMVRALRAQHSEHKYDYGGIDGLFDHFNRGHLFVELNYEQQGDVLADYFKIKTGRVKFRGVGRLEVLELYEKMLEDLVV